MRSCIYVRAYRKDKSHNRTGIERQVQHCQEVARKHNVIIERRHIFRDMDHSGSWLPTCWAAEDEEEIRPALSAMIEAMETGRIASVVVFRADRLGTSSDVLQGLLDFFTAHDISVIVAPEAAQPVDDPTDGFAFSVLGPLIVYDHGEDQQNRDKVRCRKLQELDRLKAKVARLEGEIAALN